MRFIESRFKFSRILYVDDVKRYGDTLGQVLDSTGLSQKKFEQK